MKLKLLSMIGAFFWILSISISGVNAQVITSVSDKETLKAELTAVVKSVLREHPEVILEALEEKPVALANLVQQAAIEKAVRVKEEQRRTELKNPKVADIDVERPIRGNPQASITIVEYSDFECPFCGSASSTVKQVLEQYGEDVRFVYKHNPLNFHPMAEPAARYFEAIAMQDVEEAWRFHDLVFEQQELLTDGEPVLKAIVASLNIDEQKLEQDLKGDTVEQRLYLDREEAARFGFDGTPAFLINGVSLMGSQPMEDFQEIIQMFMSEKHHNNRLAASNGS
ncbi:MAG: hypothetical protein NPIRA02_05770 [Nitrospirales bacterium]|nr:MAG: hypothetical protein NPIRA02_05770 [Nitrospirales bacterium]